MIHHECLRTPLQSSVGVAHDFVATQGGEGWSEGRVDLMSGAKDRALRRGMVRCASASSWRLVRTGVEGRGVFQLSDMILGTRHVHRA